MGFKLAMFLGLTGLLMVAQADDSNCCLPRKICRGEMFLRKCSYWCEDGTKTTEDDPHCGVGPCDADGCNCEGGCRESLFRSVDDPEEARSVLESLETRTLLELLRRKQEKAKALRDLEEEAQEMLKNLEKVDNGYIDSGELAKE
ncbi:PREDICTED: uncharacterized protein LOC109479403 isoform X2 [Branchiostoma belcheri]|nr:PREDICTED: uncharacterized protein LOC109479403 isoform X2 [Branchiostoma belcheri]XP_019636926.1 PREDICTED: uncharacterized protein LOC109479403 isoform X2 [Branchiostoma belcheri]